MRQLALVAAVVIGAPGFVDAQSSCPAVSDSAAALSRLVGEPWSEWDPDSVEEVWPFASFNLACPAEGCGSVAALGKALELCCAACGECAGLSFGGEGSASLEHVEFFLCPSAPRTFRGKARVLLGSVAPTADALVHGLPWRTALAKPQGDSAYRWEGFGQRLLLEFSNSCEADLCSGRLALTRCSVESVGGVTIDSTSAQDPSRLRARYETECYFRDRCCIESEVAGLLPDLKEEAEARGAKEIVVFAVSGCGGGASVAARRFGADRWRVATACEGGRP